MKKTKWKDLDTQSKVLKIIGYFIIALATLFTAFIIFGRFIKPIAELPFFAQVDIFTPTKGANPWFLSASYLVCISSIAFVLRKLIDLSLFWVKHGGAAISLLSSFIKYVAVIVIIFFILSSFGVDTNALIAGIGILSLVVGLAIQPLLQDVIAGIFVVFEKTYDVGDVVVIDGFRGTVIEIGIRATKLKDAGGDIKVINNSDIRTLVNMTSDLSYAICDVDIEYSESIERVEEVIANNLSVIKAKVPAIVDGPFYKGVVALGASGVTIRIVASCSEDQKFQTQRDINRQIKLIFDANEINIPFTQVVLHQAKEVKNPPVASGKTDQFVLDQNALSKSVGEEDDEK